jgi:hypothetical protein
LHVKVHTPIAHAVVAFATSAHLTLQPPQWFTLFVGSTHSVPHRRGAAGVHPVVHWKLPPVGAHIGFDGGHTALHAPQLAALERSVSQPSAELELQSPYPLSHCATTHVRPWQAVAACIEGHGEHEGSPHP